MGMKSIVLRCVCASVLAIMLFTLIVPTFAKVQNCQKSRTASNLRSLAIGYAFIYSTSIDMRRSLDYMSMEELLMAFLTLDMTDSDLFLDIHEKQLFEDEPPKMLGYLDSKNDQVFMPEILDYPIGFSFAVYRDPITDASTKPLLWTRGLHHYNEFDQFYGGYVAYADGHVTYFDGAPDAHDSMLEYTFGEESGYTNAIRILEHVPDDWKDSEHSPLPVRFAEAEKRIERKEWFLGMLGLLILPTGLGMVTVVFWIGTLRKKLVWGSVVFVVALVLLVFLINGTGHVS